MSDNSQKYVPSRREMVEFLDQTVHKYTELGHSWSSNLEELLEDPVPVDLIWIEAAGDAARVIIGVEFDGAARQWRFHFTGFKPGQGWSWQDGILTERILTMLLKELLATKPVTVVGG